MNQSNDPPKKIEGKVWEKPGKSGFSPKLSSALNKLLEAHQRGGMAEAKIVAQNHNMVLQDGRIQVTIVTTAEAIDDVRIAVEACGGDYQLHYRTLLQAMVPVPALEILAQRPDVENIREPRRAILQQ
jgi:TPP-dependent indolepyruvate ferredoxin oxidoreductase alpha subunit